MTLALNAYCQVKATASQTVASGTESFADDSDASPSAFSDGTGNNQAQKLYEAKSQSIAASGTASIDLYGTLTDIFGATLNLTAVKGIYIEADSSNGADIKIGPPASNGFLGPFGAASQTVAIKPGGKAMFLAPLTGWAVTASTADLLTVTNASTTAAALFTAKIWGY
jgi:hypothetical protein